MRQKTVWTKGPVRVLVAALLFAVHVAPGGQNVPFLVKDINTIKTVGPFPLTNVNGTLFFKATNGACWEATNGTTVFRGKAD